MVDMIIFEIHIHVVQFYQLLLQTKVADGDLI